MLVGRFLFDGLLSVSSLASVLGLVAAMVACAGDAGGTPSGASGNELREIVPCAPRDWEVSERWDNCTAFCEAGCGPSVSDCAERCNSALEGAVRNGEENGTDCLGSVLAYVDCSVEQGCPMSQEPLPCMEAFGEV